MPVTHFSWGLESSLSSVTFIEMKHDSETSKLSLCVWLFFTFVRPIAPLKHINVAGNTEFFSAQHQCIVDYRCVTPYTPSVLSKVIDYSSLTERTVAVSSTSNAAA